MPHTRVYIADVDPLPRAILSGLLEAEGDIVVIGPTEVDPDWGVYACSSVAELIEELGRGEPDVLIVGVDGDSTLERLSKLFQMRVILVSRRGGTLHYYQLRPDTGTIEFASAADVLTLVRESGAGPTATSES